MSRDDDEFDDNRRLDDDPFRGNFGRAVSVRKKSRFGKVFVGYFAFGFILFIGTLIAMGFVRDQNGRPAPMIAGLIVMAVGGAGLWYISRPSAGNQDEYLRQEDEKSDRSFTGAPRIRTLTDSELDDDEEQVDSGPVTLVPGSTPTGSFIGCLLATLFIHVFIVVFFAGRMADWRAGKFELLPDIFAIPAGLVSLTSILGVFHSFLAMFNPRPLLTLSRRSIPLGDEAKLEWRFEGNASSIRTMAFHLQGLESARYRRGTDTHTETHQFYNEPLVQLSDRLEIPAGRVEITIPGDTMHSFDGGNNKILWQIQLRGEIPFWPDVTATFPVRVIPHESAD